MNKAYVRWILAIILTLGAAVYQRLTGPTHPLRGTVTIEQNEIDYKFLRSHGGEGDQPVEFTLADTSYRAFLLYRRYRVDSVYTALPMKREGNVLRGFLPHQPPAGKLEYVIELEKAGQTYLIPEKRSVVTRFKGHVPKGYLIPHIFFMFLAMLFSSVTLFEALTATQKVKMYTIITTIILFIGGMIFGPLVQKMAFGEYWTGIPFGWDLTDNKTLFALIGWLIALVAVWKGEIKKRRWWVVGAAIILLIIFSIPHSMMGSELDYSKMEVTTGKL